MHYLEFIEEMTSKENQIYSISQCDLGYLNQVDMNSPNIKGRQLHSHLPLQT